MSEASAGNGASDLVVVTLPGVQRFIAEARSTADLHAGSGIMSSLAAAMVAVVPDGDLVMPAHGATAGTPNRVVALAVAGGGAKLANRMARAAHETWGEYLRQGLRCRLDEIPDTGFPRVQWVVVRADVGAHLAQWDLAARAMAARKRVRDFPPYDAVAPRVCTVTGRWAVYEPPSAVAPPNASQRTRVRPGEALSAVGLLKRRWRELPGNSAGFPSTLSVASGPFRAAVADTSARHPELLVTAAQRLKDAVTKLCGQTGLVQGRSDLPGLELHAPHAGTAVGWLTRAEGAWCYPDSWNVTSLQHDHALHTPPEQSSCDQGRKAASGLIAAAADVGIPPPTPYLAVVACDGDEMGPRLGQPPNPLRAREWHSEVSRHLALIGGAQAAALGSAALLGRAVYAGGDDVLGFVPVAGALTAVEQLDEAFCSRLRPVIAQASMSAAVVFFHASTALQPVVTLAQTLLKAAKAVQRPGFAAAVIRRGGERVRITLPASLTVDTGEIAAVAAVRTLADGMRGNLSGRLAATLERDAQELGSLGIDWRDREIARLIGRHGGKELGRLLYGLSGKGSGGMAELALVARFIAAETGTSKPAAASERSAEDAAS